MQRALMEKLNNIQKQMANLSRNIKTKGKILKEKLEIKNTITAMKNDFDKYISGLDTAKERISKPDQMSIETSQTEMQRFF